MTGARTEDLFVKVPGGDLYVKKWFPEEPCHGTPVFLLHESLGCTDQWRDFPERLASRLSRPVISYDRLGFGRSTARDALPGIDFIWEEADIYFPPVKAALSVGRYILFGHSVGGPMSVAIAANDRDCAAVVTESAQAFVENRTISGIETAMEVFRQPGQIDRLKKWHGEKAEWVLHAWTDIWLSPEFSSWSLESCIGKVTCPLLVLHGDHDEYGSLAFPEYIGGKVGLNSRTVILKDCGHVPHKERPQEVIDNIQSFLENSAID